MENSQLHPEVTDDVMSYDRFRLEVLNDYKVSVESREVSFLGRKEVLTGKAKFGIFGDGVEVAQIAMAKFFKPGDFRAGYYRDQTFMFSTGLSTVDQFFAQLYADPNNDPFSSGRQMNAHFATPFVDDEGNWLDLANRKNISSDIAPTGGQMPRALGLAFASKVFRSMSSAQKEGLSNNGNEICFCTIGDSSTSEGHFWEAINAAGVLQIPLAVFVWDNGYGISVPKKYQTTKGSISEALSGFKKKDKSNGINIYKVKGWDYAGMCEVFEEALDEMRETHVPAVFHVEEITQPQGHSTSGSHERYKTHDRLEWEREWDCIKKFREWIIANGLGSDEELVEIENSAKDSAKAGKIKAWSNYLGPIKAQVSKAVSLINEISIKDPDTYNKLTNLTTELQNNREPMRRDVLKTLYKCLQVASFSESASGVHNYYKELKQENKNLYNSKLYNEGPKSALKVIEVKPSFDNNAVNVNGYEVLNKYFDKLFTNNPKVFAFGEDVGLIGDVNQGFSGLQDKHGAHRSFDTGIRELTIVGQGIGMAMRGLRPFTEIQYLDYLLYALQPLSDDVATVHFRTKGQQSCPIIIRTRGHRLEGIWHSGSPMGMIINSLRGMYVCVPRNMVKAAGMYNTLLQSNDPAIVIESLNGYRLKEKIPNNLLEFTVPLGIPEVIKDGSDVTVVSYGSTLRIVMEAATELNKFGISCEVIDVQTLLPFDINHSIVESLKKTNRILFVDEDVPGGASAYMYNNVLEQQGGYRWLDVAARTLSAKSHRPPYGSDGDYFSKPNVEEVVEVIQEMMAE